MVLDRTVAPAVSKVDNFDIIRPERRIMKNGVVLNIIQSGSEDVVRLDIVIRGGQMSQSQPLQALFTNRMLREGSRKYSSSEIAEKLDYYGAWLDLSSSVNYGYVTLYSLNKYFPTTVEVLASMVKEPAFDEGKLHMLTEFSKQNFLVNEEKVDILAHKQLIRSLFGEGHRLGRFAVEEDYEKVTVDVLQQMYDSCYNSKNASVYVSGKVTDGIIRSIETYFGDEDWGSNHVVNHQLESIVSADTRKRINIPKENVLQSALRMGCISLSRKHEDYLKFKVLITLFGGYFGSRLMSNIREDKGYTYGISSGIISYPDFSVLAIGTEADNEYVLPIIDEVYKEIDILHNERVTQKELDMVKNYMLGDICRSYESAFSLSDAWIFVTSIGAEDDYFAKSIQAIHDVTCDDILSMAQKYLHKQNMKEIIAGKSC